MTVGVFLRCDELGCFREMRLIYGTKTRVLVYARSEGWQIGKTKHYCPEHRRLKRSKKQGDDAP